MTTSAHGMAEHYIHLRTTGMPMRIPLTDRCGEERGRQPQGQDPCKTRTTRRHDVCVQFEVVTVGPVADAIVLVLVLSQSRHSE